MVPSLKLSTQGDIAVLHEANVNGRWIVAQGPGFPTFGGAIPRPHDGALFFRHDLDAWYTWDEASAAWGVTAGGGGGAITVEELDGAPSVTDVTILQFAQSDGFIVTEPAPGVALVELDAIPQASISGLVADLAAKEDDANKGAAGGYAPLDGSALLPLANLPAHATRHQHGGSDEVATATPGANAIPKAGAGGTLAAGWIPTHASSHQNGGSDEISVAGLSGTLADPQTPAAHAASHQNGGGDEISVAGLSGTLADPQTPAAHAASHQHSGSDEVATATPGANAIPKAGGGGTLATGWLPAATTGAIGAVELATDGEVAANVVVQGNDTRLQNRNRVRGAKVTHSANQSIANATLAALAFDTERYDYPAWHSTVTNNSRITVDAAGVYLITGAWAYASNTTGERGFDFRINGTNYIVGNTVPPTGGGLQSANGPAAHHECANGDYIECVAYQTSGGALNADKSANYSPEFGVSLCGA